MLSVVSFGEVGIAWQLIPLGILGFVIMGGGVYFATLRRGRAKESAAPGHPGKPRSSFMSNLEERWDERRRDQ